MAGDIISMPDPGRPVGNYVAEDDVWEELPDGRVLQIARKGQTITGAEAVRLGLVKPPPAAPAPETKRDLAGPAEPKVHRGRPPVSAAARSGPAPAGAERAPAAAPAESGESKAEKK